MSEKNFASWKRRLVVLKKDIDEGIASAFAERKKSGFCRLGRDVTVMMTNGIEVKVSMLEYRDGVMSYYAGPMMYVEDEITVEGLLAICFEVERTFAELPEEN